MTTEAMAHTFTEIRARLRYERESGRFFSVRTGKEITGSRNTDGYIQICVQRRHYMASRLAWLYVTGKWPEKEIDHRNRVRDDNRFDNLREASRSRNVMNSRKRSDNTSGAKGVTWSAQHSKWRARCTVDQRVHDLGLHSTIDEASAAYRAFARVHHGEFARFE